MRRILLVALCILRLLRTIVRGLSPQAGDLFSPPFTRHHLRTKAEGEALNFLYTRSTQPRTDPSVLGLECIIIQHT